MKQPKYTIGDTVWLINCNKVMEVVIDIIHKKDDEIHYGYNGCTGFVEKDIFPTKEELIKSL